MLCFLCFFCSSQLYITNQDEKSFLSWMRENNQIYTGSEYHFRLGIYLTNLRHINEFNKGNHKFFLKANMFAASTQQEYQVLLGHINSPNRAPLSPLRKSNRNDDVPDSYDLREKGVVNRVKSQGACGSCWAFGAVAAQEINWALATGQLLSLSESNLVDCVWDCLGCNGGNAGWAMTYIKIFQSGHFMLEDDYDYTPAVGTCMYNSSIAVTKISTHYGTNYGDEDDLKQSIYHNGAHAITMDCKNPDFSYYGGGIYSDDGTCTTWWASHTMCAVGYGVEDGTGYWILKNSFGKYWGEEGYVRVIRDGNNTCGVSSSPIYPVVSTE